MATTRVVHDGHTEPSVASHAIGIWLFAIPAVWIVGDWLGYWGAAVVAFAAWLPVCWSVSSSLSCRNANQMGSRNYNKSLALAATPYAALFAYFVYYLNTSTA